MIISSRAIADQLQDEELRRELQAAQQAERAILRKLLMHVPEDVQLTALEKLDPDEVRVLSQMLYD